MKMCLITGIHSPDQELSQTNITQKLWGIVEPAVVYPMVPTCMPKPQGTRTREAQLALISALEIVPYRRITAAEPEE